LNAWQRRDDVRGDENRTACWNGASLAGSEMRRTVVVTFNRRIPLVRPDRCMTFGLIDELAEVSHNEKHRRENQQPAAHGSRPENCFHRSELTGRFLSCQESVGRYAKSATSRGPELPETLCPHAHASRFSMIENSGPPKIPRQTNPEGLEARAFARPRLHRRGRAFVLHGRIRTRVYSPPRASWSKSRTSGMLTQLRASGDLNSEGGSIPSPRPGALDVPRARGTLGS